MSGGEPASASGVKEFKALDDEALGILSNPSTFFVFLALGDGPLDAEGVAAEAGIPVEEAWRHLTTLVHAGLVELSGTTGGAGAAVFKSRHVHVMDTEGSLSNRLVFRLAILSGAEQVIRAARRALRARPETANVGLALVTLPESPEVFEKAFHVLAETEARLKALAHEAPPAAGAPRVRVALVLASQ